MGGWLTCVGNSMEWSKNAVGNSMGGVEKNGVPPQGGAGINWNSPLYESTPTVIMPPPWGEFVYILIRFPCQQSADMPIGKVFVESNYVCTRNRAIHVWCPGGQIV